MVVELSQYGRSLLLTVKDVEEHKGYDNFVVKSMESPEYLFILTDDGQPHLYVNLGSRDYVDYSYALKELLWRATVMELVEVLALSVFIGKGNAWRGGSKEQRNHFTQFHS